MWKLVFLNPPKLKSTISNSDDIELRLPKWHTGVQCLADSQQPSKHAEAVFSSWLKYRGANSHEHSGTTFDVFSV